MTSKAALVILGALATAFGFVMYVLLVGVIWGFRFPGRCGARCSHRHGHGISYLQGLAKPAVHALRLLGYVQRPGCGLYLPRPRYKDDEETIKRQAELRNFLDDIDEPSESGKQWRSVMKIAVPIWYFFAIGPACILGNKAFSFCRVPAAVVLADYLVDPGYHHDVGPVLQGRNVHHQ
jgi:SSS family solute:Na+ symporter